MMLRSAALWPLLLLLAAEPPAQTSQLLSLSVPMARDERIDAFEVETAGVEILAVCRFPALWTLSAGANSSVTGTLSGQAGYGAAMLATDDAASLANLFLVRVHARREGMPPSFNGIATVVTSGTQPRERLVPITAREVLLTPAAECPARH